jgi:hypothetical protein
MASGSSSKNALSTSSDQATATSTISSMQITSARTSEPQTSVTQDRLISATTTAMTQMASGSTSKNPLSTNSDQTTATWTVTSIEITSSSSSNGSTDSTEAQFSTTSTTTIGITTQAIMDKYYIVFSFTLAVSGDNVSAIALASQLLSIFMSALGVGSNRINITVTIGTSRSTTSIVAHVILFNGITETADQLLTRIEGQTSNSTSALRQQNLTSQLSEGAIQGITRFYVCSNSTSQQSPCSSAMSVTSTNSLLTMLVSLTLLLIV